MIKTCCFSGHRKLPKDKIDSITKRLHAEIDNLIHDGVTDFISGGALGFDLLAASMIVAKKEMGQKIKLIFMLPCPEQDVHWTSEQKKLYRSMLLEADEIIYVSDEYNDGCMKRRNYAMVERSIHCICALLYRRSGTSQTVDYRMCLENGLSYIARPKLHSKGKYSASRSTITASARLRFLTGRTSRISTSPLKRERE